MSSVGNQFFDSHCHLDLLLERGRISVPHRVYEASQGGLSYRLRWMPDSLLSP